MKGDKITTMEPQAVYAISKNAYHLVVDLTCPDADFVREGMVTVYTRSHAIAATLLTHGFGVQWKPWMQPPRNCRVVGSKVMDVLGNPICEIEIDFESTIGIRVTSIAPEVLEQITMAERAKE